jgi:hypothetical protein
MDQDNQQNLSGLQIDANPQELVAASEVIDKYIQFTSGDSDEREKIYRKRRDFFNGRHHLYSNVVGLRGKERQGHILAVFNYTGRFCNRLVQALTNNSMRYKVRPEDESDMVESIRAESEEEFHRKVLRDNSFWEVVFRRNSMIQVRDADFALKCVVEQNDKGEKEIKINWAENMEKLHVIWDDAAGTSFSAVIYKDLWTIEKIAREFDGYQAEPVNQDGSPAGESSQIDPYGTQSTSMANEERSPTGKNMLPKAWVTDTWGWFKVFGEGNQPEWKMCNIIKINKTIVQFVKTDYEHNPWMIGHSFDNPGRPWSKGFIDDLVDPQVELNDRMSEEGDMIRVGANTKYVVVNMPHFDATSVKPGSGQVIYIEGENADFHSLDVNINPFPTESYLNRTLEHLFNLGLPKIALAAGTAPYTGRVGAIQYQPISDMVDDLRNKWSPVLQELFKRIQSYAINFFPETKPFMMAHGDQGDYGPVMREVDFEWDSVLPQSRSDSIVDASTLWDRDLLPLKTMLEMSGFQDPMNIIKQLKKENADPEMIALRTRFKQFSQGAVKATLEAQREQMDAQEATGAMQGAIDQASQTNGSAPATKPMLQKWQNSGRRGVPATNGVSGVGQTASQKGNLNQTTQNLRAS